MEYPKIETCFERDAQTHKVHPDQLRKSVYGMLKSWSWTEKIDGTNIRLIWQDGLFTIGGRTDNAQLDMQLWQNINAIVTAEKLAEVFPDTNAVIYGEGYGAGIQKGIGYRPDKAFAVFDVLVDGRWWLDWENTCDVATELGLETVPFLQEGSFEDAVRFARKGFVTHIPGGTCQAEGIVGRPIETIFDKGGKRVIVKLKTKDF